MSTEEVRFNLRLTLRQLRLVEMGLGAIMGGLLDKGTLGYAEAWRLQAECKAARAAAEQDSKERSDDH